MRSRKSHKPDTFPFLAVLLCAMGALILLLLVLDRRARAVVRAKALQAAAHLRQRQATDQAEWEQRAQALHATLAAEEQQVQTELQTAQRQFADTGAEIQAIEERRQRVSRQLETAQVQLAAGEKELAAARIQGGRDQQASQAARAEIAALTRDLQRLEQTLAELKAARQREQRTYSLVPYRGKRGENRRPLYIECTATGIVFHPDKRIMAGAGVTADDVRAEVGRRVERQRQEPSAGKISEIPPYLLFLVRPDGISNYYRTVAALDGLKLDFGYEFIDRDWVLDFSMTEETKTPQPWMVGKAPRPNSSPGEKTQAAAGPGSAAPGLMTGNGPSASEPSSRGGPAGPGGKSGSLGGPRGMNVAVGVREGGPEGAPGAGTGQGGNAGGPAGGAHSSGGPSLGTSAGGARGVGLAAPVGLRSGGVEGEGGPEGAPGAGNGPGGDASGSPGGMHSGGGTALVTSGGGTRGVGITAPMGLRSGGAEGEGGYPHGGSETIGPPPGATGNGNPGGTETTGVTASAGPAPMTRPISSGGTSVAATAPPVPSPDGPPHPTLSMAETVPQPAPTGRSIPPSPQGTTASPNGETGEPGPTNVTPSLGPLSVTAKKPTSPPPAPRLVGNRDWFILIECKADALVLYPGGQRVTTEQLAVGQQGAEGLIQAVERMIARRQAMVRPGEPPYRPQVRFLVRPDGAHTFYLGYPLLEKLQVPSTRQNIDAEEEIR